MNESSQTPDRRERGSVDMGQRMPRRLLSNAIIVPVVATRVADQGELAPFVWVVDPKN
ncbi:MAG: hypothetical protein GTO24_07635 [candidate division Zixibacteria bacterium]|nr:hypothetical protein [candidate division Zixibacteria bacterium]